MSNSKVSINGLVVENTNGKITINGKPIEVLRISSKVYLVASCICAMAFVSGFLIGSLTEFLPTI